MQVLIGKYYTQNNKRLLNGILLGTSDSKIQLTEIDGIESAPFRNNNGDWSGKDGGYERAAGKAGQEPEGQKERQTGYAGHLHGPFLRHPVRLRDHPPMRRYAARRQLRHHLPRRRRTVLRRFYSQGAHPGTGGRLQRRLRQGPLRRQADPLSPQRLQVQAR